MQSNSNQIVTPGDPRPPVTADGRLPLVIAHRGASGHAPENTMAAFDLAVELGAQGIELDVQLAADGLPVVIHDLRVDRTTNSAGNVSLKTSEQLGRLDAGAWFDRRLKLSKRAAQLGGPNIYSGQSVPTLESVLDRLSGAGLVRVYVEIKGRPADRERLLNAVLGIVATSTDSRLDHTALVRPLSGSPRETACAGSEDGGHLLD